jgi:hypothetical protein
MADNFETPEPNSPEANLAAQQQSAPPDQAQPLAVTDKEALAAELKRLREKAFENGTFTREEKITLLKTRFLPYKALAAPESIAPEERNRLLNRPPPDEVAANVLRITKGISSTAEELIQRAADDANSLTTQELILISRGFFDLDGIYDGGRHLTWGCKWGDAAEAALQYITTDDGIYGIRQAITVLFITPGRSEEHNKIIDAKLAEVGGDDNAKERANEKSKQWELHDQKLLREAAVSMDLLLQELLKDE